MKVTAVAPTADTSGIILRVEGTFGTYTQVFDADKFHPVQTVDTFLALCTELERKVKASRAIYMAGQNVMQFPAAAAVEAPSE